MNEHESEHDLDDVVSGLGAVERSVDAVERSVDRVRDDVVSALRDVRESVDALQRSVARPLWLLVILVVVLAYHFWRR